MTLDSREFTPNALLNAARHVEDVDRPVLACNVFGRKVWVIPAGTQMGAVLPTYSETVPELRAEARMKLLLGHAQWRRMRQPQRYRAMEKEL